MFRRVLVSVASTLFAAGLSAADPSPGSFASAVQPALSTCKACHNSTTSSGDLDLSGFEEVATVESQRERWEKIVLKVRSAEMPPPGFPPLDEVVRDTLLDAARAEFDRLDAAAPPDPGRITARRLNRTEYSNTIRDLLGLRFDARGEFPSDDSGHGFDNIGDVLTISPTLMDKYISAAETISRRALAADPLPARPVEAIYEGKAKTIRRLGPGMIEARHRVEWDGEYTVRIGLQGERPEGSAPVLLRFGRDGGTLHEEEVATGPSGLAFFQPYSETEFRIYLSSGDSTFRAQFVDDEFPDSLDTDEVFNKRKNKHVDAIVFVGPFPSEIEPPSRKGILICEPSSGGECVRRIVSRLARRAYRRPVSPDEVDSLLGFVSLAEQEGLSSEQGIQLAVQAMLVSPHFLYRIEHDPDPNDAKASHRVSDFELASRLSYFLWSSMPDDELLDLAQAGRLRAELGAQVERMLADPRSAAFAESFSGQWLETRALDSVNPDPDLFPEWDDSLREAMKGETTRFFDAILRENRSIAEFLDADFTFVNAPLAKHYGIDGVRGEEFQRIELDSPQRGGILSHASVLTVTSYPTRTSPVIRGKYVLEAILGQPPPDPPDNVPALEQAGVGPDASVREQLEAHRADPACASCHARMDQLGFGLEKYDAIGRWRDVESSGALPNGKVFESPEELRRILLDDTDLFAHALTEKMLIYALGRGLEPYDRITVNKITKSLAADEYRFQTLIREIVSSLPFQNRRGEDSE